MQQRDREKRYFSAPFAVPPHLLQLGWGGGLGSSMSPPEGQGTRSVLGCPSHSLTQWRGDGREGDQAGCCLLQGAPLCPVKEAILPG